MTPHGDSVATSRESKSRLARMYSLSAVSGEPDLPPKQTFTSMFKTPELTTKSTAYTAFVCVVLPVILYYMNLACNRISVVLQKIRFNNITEVNKPILMSFFLWAAILFAVYENLPSRPAAQPLFPSNAGNKNHLCNGNTCLILLYLAIGVFSYFDLALPSSNNDILYLVISSTSFAALLAAVIPYVCVKDNRQNYKYRDQDVKAFLMLRIAPLTWQATILICLVSHYRQHRHLPLNAIILAVMQSIYILDSVYFEAQFLSTRRYRHDPLNFPEIFNCCAWIPFFNTLCIRYALIKYDQTADMRVLMFSIILFCVGYYVMRGSNMQKNWFKLNVINKDMANMKAIPTSTRNLICDGFWKNVCHPNYAGDIMIALSFALPGGINLFSWSYAIYTTVVLLRRANEDDMYCFMKYGAVWHKYRSIVKHRIIPYIY